MTKEGGKTYMEKFKVHSKEMEGLQEKYQAALQQLQQVLKVCIYIIKITLITSYTDLYKWLQNHLLETDFKQKLRFWIFYLHEW